MSEASKVFLCPTCVLLVSLRSWWCEASSLLTEEYLDERAVAGTPPSGHTGQNVEIDKPPAREQGGCNVIQHIVVLKWKAGTTDAQVDHVFAQAQGLVQGIDGVQRITLGRNRGEAGHGYTHAFIVDLYDEDALTGYLNHPVRKRYVTEVLGPIEEERIEIEVPGDASDRHTRGASLSWEWGATRHSASADAALLRWEEKELGP